MPWTGDHSQSRPMSGLLSAIHQAESSVAWVPFFPWHSSGLLLAYTSPVFTAFQGHSQKPVNAHESRHTSWQHPPACFSGDVCQNCFPSDATYCFSYRLKNLALGAQHPSECLLDAYSLISLHHHLLDRHIDKPGIFLPH